MSRGGMLTYLTLPFQSSSSTGSKRKPCSRKPAFNLFCPANSTQKLHQRIIPLSNYWRSQIRRSSGSWKIFMTTANLIQSVFSFLTQKRSRESLITPFQQRWPEVSVLTFTFTEFRPSLKKRSVRYVESTISPTTKSNRRSKHEPVRDHSSVSPVIMKKVICCRSKKSIPERWVSRCVMFRKKGPWRWCLALQKRLFECFWTRT